VPIRRKSTGISITITPSDRGRLEVLAGDRNSPQKHAWRAAIVLLSADGFGTNEIMRRTGKSKTCTVSSKTRRARIPPLGPEVAERVVSLTLTDPQVEATYWTADLMAQASGISASAVPTAGLQSQLDITSGQSQTRCV
jgi:hypothetical protein